MPDSIRQFYEREYAQDDTEDEGATCRLCGATGLSWQRVWGPTGTERPVLWEGAHKHECRAQADDFEDVSGAANA